MRFNDRCVALVRIATLICYVDLTQNLENAEHLLRVNFSVVTLSVTMALVARMEQLCGIKMKHFIMTD